MTRVQDYPLSERAPERILSARGKPLNALTLEAVLFGEVSIEDLRITPEALRAQADIARLAGRPALADNFERGAELVHVPQDLIMDTYELLRPGRAKTRCELVERARLLRTEYRALRLAEFIEEAAEQYKRRGLVTD
ncbi:MAG: glycerol dehydratase [Rhizobiaceae bacterium]|nr:glycerol dehydratase [Rhizobiaceae bacterium]